MISAVLSDRQDAAGGCSPREAMYSYCWVPCLLFLFIFRFLIDKRIPPLLSTLVLSCLVLFYLSFYFIFFFSFTWVRGISCYSFV